MILTIESIENHSQFLFIKACTHFLRISLKMILYPPTLLHNNIFVTFMMSHE